MLISPLQLDYLDIKALIKRIFHFLEQHIYTFGMYTKLEQRKPLHVEVPVNTPL